MIVQTTVYLLALSAFVVLYAHYCAYDDYLEIIDGTQIKHSLQWLARAAVAVIATVVIASFADVRSWRVFWISCTIFAMLFSAVFRHQLNRYRGKNWYYISNSNLYDSAFLWIAGQNVRTGGTIAYATEITIAAFSVALTF